MPEPKRKFSYEKTLLISIIISLLVHLFLFLIYAFPIYHIFPQLDFLRPEIPVQKPKPEQQIEFELVDTPDDADPLTEQKNTRFVSDKSAQARDLYAQNDMPLGDAYTDGNFDVNEYLLNQLDNPTPAVQPSPASPQKEAPEKPVEKPETKEEKLPEKKNSWLKHKFRSPQDEFKQAAFLSQFQSASDRRPIRKNNPLRKQTKTSVKNLGGFSLNTYAWNWAPYLQNMKEKIDRHLFPPQAFTRMGLINGESLIRFKVYPDGRVDSIEVLDYEGHRSLMETSLNSIKGADPFLPLPKDFPRDKEYLEITAHFQFFIDK